MSKLDLVGRTEIAQRAGVKPDTVKKWAMRHQDFPTPAAELAQGPIWRWRDVARWIETRKAVATGNSKPVTAPD